MSEQKENTNEASSDKSTLQLSLPLDVVQYLDAQAAQRGLSRDEVIQEMLTRAVQEKEAQLAAERLKP